MNAQSKPSILGLSRKELQKAMGQTLLQPYQAGQIMAWTYQRGVVDFAGMTDLPAPLRSRLAGRFAITALEVARTAESADGTTKLLLRAADGQSFECVLIPGRGRLTACLSSQAGCRLGCAFCATGDMEFGRNLSPADIVEQLIHLSRAACGRRITNVVFMGMGEPLDNYEHVLPAARLINSPDAFGLGARHITISTAGLVPGIERLAAEPEQFKLAVSLNAADDATRDRLMPVNRKYSLAELIASVKHYAARTGKLVTFEYVLLAGTNDRKVDAGNLGRLLKGLPSKVNLIPFNGGGEAGFRPPSPAAVREFHRLLSRLHPKVTVRASKGQDIAAACGMLKAATVGRR